MRLDKYLKVSRLIKRRTIAKQLADNERILINGRIAKASSEVAVDDIIQITFGTKVNKFQVLKVLEYVKKDDTNLMYLLIEE